MARDSAEQHLLDENDALRAEIVALKTHSLRLWRQRGPALLNDLQEIAGCGI